MTQNRTRPYIITLLRHGESVGNAESRWQGQTDYPLNETGRAQASALASRWKREGVRFDLILTSTLVRAKETAEILGETLGVQVVPDPLWIERDVGSIAGATPTEVRARFPQGLAASPFESINGDGEGNWELFLRAGRALHSVLRRSSGSYLVVSHGGILNLLMHAVVGIAPPAHFTGPRFRFGNTGFARVIYFPAEHRWDIDSVNDLGHWQTADTEVPEA